MHWQKVSKKPGPCCSSKSAAVTINEAQDEIIKSFSALGDWLDKYEYIVKLGKQHVGLDESARIQENALAGCQSQVWIDGHLKDGCVSFAADSDALITRGILALLLLVLNHHPAEEIVTAELYFLSEIGLSTNLSPARANGLASIVKHMRTIADSLCHQQKATE